MKLKKLKTEMITIRVSSDLKSALIKYGIDTGPTVREFLEKLIRKIEAQHEPK